MGASLGSHGTGDVYQLGYMRFLRVESMRLRIPSCAVTSDPLIVPFIHVYFTCLPSMSAVFRYQHR